MVKAVVWLLALVGLASLGLDWRKGDFGIYKWDRTPSGPFGASGESGVYFLDASSTYRTAEGIRGDDGDQWFYEEGVTWKFQNSLSNEGRPVSLSFPIQKYLVEHNGYFRSVDMPDEIVNATPIILTENETREIQVKTGGMCREKNLPRRQVYYIAAIVNGKQVLLCQSGKIAVWR